MKSLHHHRLPRHRTCAVQLRSSLRGSWRHRKPLRHLSTGNTVSLMRDRGDKSAGRISQVQSSPNVPQAGRLEHYRQNNKAATRLETQGHRARGEDESDSPHFPAMLKMDQIVADRDALTILGVVDQLVQENRGTRGLEGQQGQCQLLGWVGIVALFGHKPEKKTDRFRRGTKDLEGYVVEFWRGALMTVYISTHRVVLSWPLKARLVIPCFTPVQIPLWIQPFNLNLMQAAVGYNH